MGRLREGAQAPCGAARPAGQKLAFSDRGAVAPGGGAAAGAAACARSPSAMLRLTAMSGSDGPGCAHRLQTVAHRPHPERNQNPA